VKKKLVIWRKKRWFFLRSSL